MLRVSLITLLATILAASARAQGGASSPASDLFAPVKAQFEARKLEAEKAIGRDFMGPETVANLLESGQPDLALKILPSVTGDPRQVALARANAYLLVQDFAAARPLAESLLSKSDLSDPERQLVFAWLFAIDDMARVDDMTRGHSLEPGTTAPVPDLLAAGRLAYELLNYDRAEVCFQRALDRLGAAAGSGQVVDITSYMTGKGAGKPDDDYATFARSEALKGLGQVLYKRRNYDGSLARVTEAIGIKATPAALYALADVLIRLGRTDDAVSAAEWTIRLNPYHGAGHYLLGNGYTRKSYTELFVAFPTAFSDAAGREALARADSLLAHGDRAGARNAYQAVRDGHTGWADPLVRLASLDFEDGAFESARDLCFQALAVCPDYGRAHATLAKALESQRYVVDVHRAEYERKFAGEPTPDVPDIDHFVLNWHSLSPRHQKRVALSVAPWKQFIPVLIEGGSTYYIKPLYMLLSETPGQETLRDQRINYDSRLWDDVRGCGGYHTVTGIEDVERTIFDQYNTVLHELTHQVHGVLTADQSRVIQEHYIKAKDRDEKTKNGFLSRYAGGSVYEYFAEGANALESPRRDAYDTREVVKDRLETIDPDLKTLVLGFLAQKDVSASYPVAYVNAGGDFVGRGKVDPAIGFYEKALAKDPNEESALQSMVYAMSLKGDRDGSVKAVDRAVQAHPASGPVLTTAAEALWHAGRGVQASVDLLTTSRDKVRPEDRYLVDLALGRYYWIQGSADQSLAAYDLALAYQSDNPEALWGRAAALALARKWDDAFKVYDEAVRLRTGVVDLRNDYARDLLLAGQAARARKELDEALLLDGENPTAEALRGWALLDEGKVAEARTHLDNSLGWGPWSDLTRILMARAAQAAGDPAAASAAVQPLRERIDSGAPPEYIFREKLSEWRSVHEMPAVERGMLDQLTKP